MISSKILVLCLALNSLYLVQSAEVFDVHKYGAVADGVHKNTDAIAKAIAAAHAHPGGGTVHFTKGTYLTGPIHFKSNVHLHLDEGVTIKFSDNFDDYMPFVLVRFEGIQLMNFSPLIYAMNATNIGITGKGVLDGNGHKWYEYTKPFYQWMGHHGSVELVNDTRWQKEFRKLNHDLIEKYRGSFSSYWIFDFQFIKPDFFQPMYSDHITLEGVTFINSPFWTVVPTFSDHIHIEHITIRNPHNIVNTDGINPNSCRNVTIRNCEIETGDDAIALKAGKDVQAREIGRASENITIENIIVKGGIAAFAIGSEMAGSVRNVFVRNITATKVWNGILIKTCRGRGGVVENVHITDMHILDKSSTYSIQIYPLYTYGCMHNVPHKMSELTPTFKDFYITNFSGTSNKGAQIVGLPENHFKNFHLTNVHLKSDHPEEFNNLDNFVLTNFTYDHLK